MECCADIFEASKVGHCACIERSVSSDVNKYDHKGVTPLMYAAERGHIDAVQLLIKKSANVNTWLKTKSMSKCKGTALMCALLGDHPDIVEYLIQHGADLYDGDGEDIPITYAARQGKLQCLKVLAQHVDVNIKHYNKHEHEKMTPLIWAMYDGHVECVEYLLSVGARITWFPLSMVLFKHKANYAKIWELINAH